MCKQVSTIAFSKLQCTDIVPFDNRGYLCSYICGRWMIWSTYSLVVLCMHTI